MASMIKRLSVNNRVFYKENLNLSSFRIDTSIFSKINTKFIFFFYGINVIPLNQGNNITYIFSENLYSSFQKINFKIKKNLILKLSKKVNEIYQIPTADILLLIPIINESLHQSDKLIKLYSEILNYCRNLDVKVHIKYHPREKFKFLLEKDVFEIPSEIPANAMVNYNFVIGFASATIFEAANYGINSISLTHILQNKQNDSINNYLKSNLKTGKKLFFQKILKN